MKHLYLKHCVFASNASPTHYNRGLTARLRTCLTLATQAVLYTSMKLPALKIKHLFKGKVQRDTEWDFKNPLNIQWKLGA